ncbi:hypothetical protein [Bradyrhizobium sp. SZCCHNS3004]|uniref:hypothetical protein n=1 Tax=Bradyrhizobium sp. SZCCHNS3004 TaxID=3057312 RepID=UPI0029168E0F|nr:hypothetical protein [Bradyrhizobium sp. SZCCHNS3004]
MPVSAHPGKRDFFVYEFKVDGYPFYVGIGRDRRATDRVRYVRSLMVPHNADKLAKRSLSVRVMAALLRRDASIKLVCTKVPMNRRQALAREKQKIERLVAAGFLLTNWQHNPRRHNNVSRAVRAIVSKKRY